MRNDAAEKAIKPLLDSLAEGKLPPWTQPWKCRDGRPFNGNTGNNYRGGNFIYLWIMGMIKGYQDPRWMGMKQANELGGRIKAGSKGTVILYPKKVKDRDNPDETICVGFGSAYVWHISQIEGLNMDRVKPIELQNIKHDPIEKAEEWISRLKPKMMIGTAASYCRQTDTICMPPMSSFDTAMKYYKVLLHEIGHWTGSPERLGREKGKYFGDEKYGFEELVAEIFSLLACHEIGLEIEHEIKDTAAYCQHWHSKLSENPNWLPMAAEAAEKALQFCLKGEIKIEDEQHEISAEVA